MTKQEFAVEIIAKGSFIDDRCEDKNFLVETAVIRLNGVALNEWIFSKALNDRSCYNNDKLMKYELKQEEKLKIFNHKIINALGITANFDNVTIRHSVSEFFTVVCISEI